MYRADIQGTFRAMNVCEHLWDGDDEKVDMCKLGAKNAHLDGNRDNNVSSHSIVDIRHSNMREYFTGRYMAYDLSEKALDHETLLHPLRVTHPYTITHPQHHAQPLFFVHVPIFHSLE